MEEIKEINLLLEQWKDHPDVCKMIKALGVFILDEKLSAVIRDNDQNALRQAKEALGIKIC